MVESLSLAVVGAHLVGQPLHHQLSERDASLVARTVTAPIYRMYALSTTPPKPGMVRVAAGEAGAAIEVEVWAMAPAHFGTFVDAVPAPLAIGRLVLGDGTDVAGFVVEPVAVRGALDITRFGGWRAYLASLS